MLQTWVLAQLADDGTLDPTFGSGGTVVFPPPAESETPVAFVLLADGSILAAGNVGAVGSTTSSIQLRHLLADGTLDPTFGSSGTVTTSFGGSDAAAAMVLQPDGAVVVAGSTTPSLLDLTTQVQLIRYLGDGTLDPSFGTGGRVVTTFAETRSSAEALALQPDGALVAAGSTTRIDEFPGPISLPTDQYPILARYLPDGSLDPTFGSGGKVSTRFGTLGYTRFVTDTLETHVTLGSSISRLALQADGSILVGGQFPVAGVVARYDPSGTLDPSFGKCAVLTTGFVNDVGALLVQPDGKLVGAFGTPGDSENPGGLLVARYGGAPAACRAAAPGRASLTMKTAFPNAKFGFDRSKFAFKWVGTPGSTLADFGDPTSTACA